MRDFEKEYKEYTNQDVPDLWNRIEEALPEKSKDVNEEPKEEKKKVVSFFKRYQTIVAAACLVLILVPTIIWMNLRGDGNMSEESAKEAQPFLEAEMYAADVNEEGTKFDDMISEPESDSESVQDEDTEYQTLKDVVYAYIDATNKQDTYTYIELFVEEERTEMYDFLEQNGKENFFRDEQWKIEGDVKILGEEIRNDLLATYKIWDESVSDSYQALGADVSITLEETGESQLSERRFLLKLEDDKWKIVAIQ